MIGVRPFCVIAGSFSSLLISPMRLAISTFGTASVKCFHDYFYEASEILLWPTNW